MNEQKFLSLLEDTYGSISEPQKCAVEFEGIDKKIVHYTSIDRTQNPPTLESLMVTYYVKDVGTENEEVLVSPSISNPIAVTGVKSACVAAAAKG